MTPLTDPTQTAPHADDADAPSPAAPEQINETDGALDARHLEADYAHAETVGASDGAEVVHDAAVDATESRVEEIDHDALDEEGVPDNSPLGRFKKSRYRSLATFAGAVLIGGLLAPLVIQPRETATVAASELGWEMAMPASATAILAESAAPGVTLSGKVSPVADITGKAPVGGAIARWVVQPGARVEAGQAVAQITSGPATAAPLPGESRQIVAEKQQNAAAEQQLDLAQTLSATRTKLVAAQERVARAQGRIGETRALIARLRSGEVVTGDAPPPPVKSPKPQSKPNPQLAAARAKTAGAQKQLAETINKLANARTDVSAAQKGLPALQSKVDEAEQNAKTIETKFDGSLTNAADLQAARLALSNARGTLKAATERASAAQKQIPTLEKQLAERQSAAENARAAQKKLAPTISVDAPQPELPANVSAPRPTISIDTAVKQAQAALTESRAATREADRLHALVDQYQEQAQKSNAKIESATKVLETVQTPPVQAVPRVRFTAANAPADGTVVWIARLAREVGPGQSVFGLSSGKKFVARFEDRSNDWKNARVGQTVNALVAPPAPEPSVEATTATTSPNSTASLPVEVLPSNAAAVGTQPATQTPARLATPPALSPETASELGAKPVTVKLTRIAPPEAPGEPAIIEGEMVSQTGSGAGPNWQLLASLPDPKKATILTVPTEALVQRNNKTYVAVLEPNDKATAKKAEGAATTDDAVSYNLQWQEVSVKAGDGVTNEVQSGLKAGQRVITDPLPLLAQAPPSAPAMPRVRLSGV